MSGCDEHLVIEDETFVVFIDEDVVELVIYDGAIPGPAGQDGEGATNPFEAGETIHGGRAVMAVDGLLYHPDITIVDHASQVIGVATQSGSAGTTIGVRTSGIMIDGAWVNNRVIFCGQDGVLTQSPGGTGWLLAVARAVDVGALQVAVQLPFLR